MSRFADRSATERMSLGACQCPGTPHEDDWIEMRTQLGMSDITKMVEGDSIDTLELVVVSWNLLDNDSSEAATDRDHFERLYAESFQKLDVWTDKHINVGVLPNPNGAPSRNGSGASAATRRTRKLASPATSR